MTYTAFNFLVSNSKSVKYQRIKFQQFCTAQLEPFPADYLCRIITLAFRVKRERPLLMLRLLLFLWICYIALDYIQCSITRYCHLLSELNSFILLSSVFSYFFNFCRSTNEEFRIIPSLFDGSASSQRDGLATFASFVVTFRKMMRPTCRVRTQKRSNTN